MKTILKLQYTLLLTCLWTAISVVNLQAQCQTWIDFTDEGLIPDGCGTVWTEDNQPIELQIIPVNDAQYTCNSSQADCTHTKDKSGLTLENSVLEFKTSLVDMYKLHVEFLETIEEGEVSLSLFNGSSLLQTVVPNSFGQIVFQDAAILQQTTKMELFVCEGIVENFVISYDCLGINQEGDNYCNMFDTMDVLSLGGNFDENEALLSIGEGVLVYQQPAHDLFYSDSWWLGISVLDNDVFGNPLATGKNVRMHGSLRFDFSPLSDPVQKVQFAVEKPFLNPKEYWKPINIRVNGEDLVIAQNIWDVTSVAPNVSLSVTGTAPQIVTLTGEIEELVIGGHNTYLSLFCYETGTPVEEENDKCLSFEGVVEGIYGGGYLSLDNFKAGDFLFAEDGVALFMQNGHYLSDIRKVQVTNILSSNFNDFGTEQFIIVDSTGIEFDFRGHSEKVVSLEIPYLSVSFGKVSLQVNGEELHIKSSFTDIPTQVASGVNLTATYDETTLIGVISLEGNIKNITLAGYHIRLDDVCFETAPYTLAKNACFDFDDLYLTRFGSRTFATDAYGGEVIYNYEGLPISLEGNPSEEGATAGHLDFNVLGDGTGNVLVQEGGIGFDFSSMNKPLTQVSFDYGNTGTFYLTINDFPTIEVVNHQVVGTPPTDFEIVIDQNVVYINGNVQKLIVSGENVLIDNLCYLTTSILPDYCNLFDELDNATISYNQGDLVFNLDGIPVYGEPNYSESGSFWLNDFIVSDTFPDGSPYTTGTNLYLTNALYFDFSVLDETVNQVRFAWSESGNLPTPINIQVNGEPLVIAHDIRDVTSIAPNVSITVTGESPQMVTLTGEIEHLTIGGVETNVSLFCYETNKATLQNEWDYCLSFEGITAGYYGFNNSYSVGDFVFAEDGVEAYFEAFDFDGDIWSDPSMEVIESASTVGEPQILFDSGQFIYLNATNLRYDFGKLEGQVQQLQIDYVWGGSTVNLQVNGETLQVANNFTDMPSTIADGVTMTVNFNEATSNGFIALKGNIESFAIGGGEFWIDNLCFNEVPPSPPANACLDFDNFYLTQTVPYFYNNNTEFGETIFNYNGIPITLEDYQIGGNPTGYSSIIFDPTESSGQGSLLFFNGSIGFDFGAVEETVGQVSFFHSVYDENVLINLKINDFPTIETTDLATVILPDGYEIVVSGTFNQFVTITGAIQKLIIGGDGLEIDNLCYQTSDNNGVWPGDTNNDGIANNFDLLQIGVAYNNTGSPRMNPTLAWIGQASDDWTGEFADGVNHKYADCNGDGEILLDDLEGIIQNYGKTHAKNGGKSGTAEDAPLYVELPDEGMNQGDNLTAPIILGTLDIPATDVYGIAFTVSFDSELIDPESVAVTFEDCWLGTEGENIITLSQPFGEEGTIDVAITRIDLTNQTGYGTIGTLSGIIDNIAGLKSAQQDLVVIISNVRAISANQTEIPVFPTADTVIVTDIHDEIIAASIEVFPIPTKEYLQVRVPDLQKVHSLQFFDLTGRLVMNLEKEEVVFEPNLQLDVRELQQGIYFLKLDYDGVLVSRKVVLE